MKKFENWINVSLPMDDPEHSIQYDTDGHSALWQWIKKQIIKENRTWTGLNSNAFMHAHRFKEYFLNILIFLLSQTVFV